MNMQSFDFNDLIIFEMANNHQGKLDHGLAIINEMGKIAKKHAVRASVKFQFRQLDSFIHPSHRVNSTNKHIPRFLSTRLTRKEFETMADAVRKAGMIPMCTPFDEESVDLIEQMGFDIIKIGSCSAKDWPLLERVAEAGKPVIFSTGGLTISDIDKVVSFFDHRGVEYAIMHCVAIYPVPEDKFNLNQIEMLRNRYPNKTIGWSTHEDPNETDVVQLAVAKGARMFEKHVGLATDKITLNTYSASPEQVDKWLGAYKRALTICGQFKRENPTAVEVESIASLQRGIYVKSRIEPGVPIDRSQVYFAMPYQEGQLVSGQWRELMIPKKELQPNQPLLLSDVDYPVEPERTHLQTAVHNVKALLNEAHVYLSSEFKVEYSHHYGMENFSKFGCVLIECINREYCKKVIVQLPGQMHPAHFHRLKEETFQILHGEMHVEIDGHHRVLGPGDTLLVLPGVWHRFWTETGCVAEEISTTHYNNDSVYQDKKINKLTREERKTIVDHWGRFQVGAKKEARG